MKKGIIILCIVVAVAFVVVNAVEIGQLIANIAPYKIVVDGVEQEFEKPVVNIDGSTYAPVRELCEKLGIYLSWDEKEKAVVINTDDEMDCNNWILFDKNGVYTNDKSKYGYMDKTGKIKIPAQFDYAYNFSEGFAVVAMHHIYEVDPPADTGALYGPHGYINSKGEYMLKDKHWLLDFHDGLAVVGDEQGKYVINNKFEKVFNANYATVLPFLGGYAAVQTKGTPYPSPIQPKWSYIDVTGKRATDQEFDEVREFSEGMAAVKQNGKWGVIDSKFNLVIDYQYDNMGNFSYGRLMVEKDGKRGFVDKAGKVIIDLKYDSPMHFSEGVTPACVDKKYGFINTEGKVVIPFEFRDAQGFSEGLAAVLADNGNYGYINAKGEYIIEPIYMEAFQFKNGLARVRSDTIEITYHYINKKGERVDPHN